ncbi:hypothetical protein HMPREF0682_1950 [Propionibacterium acidifaciens F0233]|uniref:Uncharacterized protein n=1 Tax=Propionibacterium acidifaciens F0233 TaxID=553198 RepID=U2QFC6_9ACTN|nr:hypothetical protein HMPREF0682_1950 [Propionibacterium acidifaciens F0233]
MLGREGHRHCSFRLAALSSWRRGVPCAVRGPPTHSVRV